MTLGQKLRFYRKKAGYTQEQICLKFGFPRATYIYYETDKALPSVRTVLAFARMYGVPMEVLVDDELMPADGGEFLKK